MMDDLDDFHCNLHNASRYCVKSREIRLRGSFAHFLVEIRKINLAALEGILMIKEANFSSFFPRQLVLPGYV